MERIEHQRFGEERALYGSRDLCVLHCAFAGDEDGESAFKESRDVYVGHCDFALRYPFWHNDRLTVEDCDMRDTCRAPLWYCSDMHVKDSRLHGTKAVRECRNVRIDGCDIRSEEFGWFSQGVRIDDSRAEGSYFLLHSRDVSMEGVSFYGKYSFQYVENCTITKCMLDTKDAFWHAKNITVTDTDLRGEYVGWYSENLTLIRCRISGTQPFCYCKNLRLIDCELCDADLAFEKSEVYATITTHVVSIKNPLSGCISVPSVGELIADDPQAQGQVNIREEDRQTVRR